MRREGRAIHAVATHSVGERGKCRKESSVQYHAYQMERSTAVSRIKYFCKEECLLGVTLCRLGLYLTHQVP